MKLTTRGRFAVTSMLDIALYGTVRPVSLAEIATRQDISVPYLEQIFCKLRRAKLVRSYRGPGGGYKLARGENEITAGEIVCAVEDKVKGHRCSGTASRGGAECLANGLWSELDKVTADFLNQKSLKDIKRLYAAQANGFSLIDPPRPVRRRKDRVSTLPVAQANEKNNS